MHDEMNVFYPVRKSGACNPFSRNYRSLLYREENRDASGALVSCVAPRLSAPLTVNIILYSNSNDARYYLIFRENKWAVDTVILRWTIKDMLI